MKNLFTFFLFFCCNVAFSQGFMQDVNGRPVFELKYTDIEGSPYLQDEWSLGNVTTPNGKTYSFPKVRFDAFNNELEYEKEGKLFRLSKEITEFSMGLGVFRKNFPVVDNRGNEQFYAVLYDGKKTKLLRHVSIKILTERPYNSATDIKRFNQDITFYVLANGEMKRIKKDKKSLLNVLADKSTAIEQFVKDQKIKFSQETDLIKVVEFYENN